MTDVTKISSGSALDKLQKYWWIDLEPVWIHVPHLESKLLCVITQPQLLILSFPLEGWIFSKHLKMDGNILSHINIQGKPGT